MDKQNQFQSSLIRLDRLDKTVKPQAFYDNRKRDYEKYVADRQSLYSDYNDPYQINSVADVVLTTFNTNMKRESFFGLENIPILNMLPAIGQLTWKYTLKPALKGDFGAVLLNNLQNFGETMDTVANPLKGLLYDGSQGLVDALGWGSNGRKNYDVNSKELVDLGWGNLVVDMMAEIVLDPTNWVGLFGAKIGSTILGAPIQEAIKDAIPDLADDAVKYLTKKSIKSYLKGDFKSLNDSLAQVIQTVYNPHGLVDSINSKLAKHIGGINITDKVMKEYAKTINKVAGVIGDDVYKRLFSISLDKTAGTVLDSLTKLRDITDKIDSTLAKSWLASTGVGAGYLFYKHGLPKFRAVENQLDRLVDLDSINKIKNADVLEEVIAEKMGNLKMAKVVSDSELVSSTNLKTAISNSIDETIKTIRSIFEDTTSSAQIKQAQLDLYLRKVHGVNSLDEFIADVSNITKINFTKEIDDLVAIKRLTESVIDSTIKATSTQEINNTIEFLNNFRGVSFEKLLNEAYLESLEDLAYSAKIVDNSFIQQQVELSLYSINTAINVLKERINMIPNNIIDKSNPLINELTEELKNITNKIYQGVINKNLETFSSGLENTFSIFNTKFEQLVNHVIHGLEIADTYKPIAKSISIDKFITKSEANKQLNNMIKEALTNSSDTVSRGKYTYHFDVLEAETDVNEIYDVLQKLPNFKAKNSGNLITDPNDLTHYFGDTLQNFKNSFDDLFNLTKAVDEQVSQLLKNGMNITEAEDLTKQALANLTEQYTYWYNEIDRLVHNISPVIDEKTKVKIQTIDVTKIEEMLDKINPNPNKVTETLTVMADGKYYFLKQENMWVSLDTVNSPVMSKMIEDFDNELSTLSADINTRAKLYKELLDNPNLNISDEDRELARLAFNIKSSLEYAKNYKTLATLTLDNKNISTSVKTAFLSSIEKMYMKNPEDVITKLDYNSNELMKQVENFLQSASRKESLSLDNLAKSPEFRHIVYEQHTAKGDVTLLKEILKSKYAKYFEDSDVVFKVLDLETTGVNKYDDNILDFFIDDLFNDNTFSLKRKINPSVNSKETNPSIEFLEKLGKTKDEYFKMYEKGIETDKDFILEINKYFGDLLKKNEKIVLIVHNGYEFDIPFLKKAFSNHGLDPKIFDRIQIIDSLELMQKELGMPFLMKSEKDELTKIFELYSQLMYNSNLNKFVSSGVSDLLSNTKAYRKILSDAIKPNQQLKIGNTLGMEFRATSDILEQINVYTSEFSEFIEKVWKTNKDLRQSFIYSDMFDTEKTDKGFNMFMDMINTIYHKNSPLSKTEFIETYGSYIDMSKFLYMMNEGVNTYGYKVAIDWDLINKYTNFNVGDDIDANTAKGLTNVLRMFQRQRINIKNSDALYAIEEELNKALATFTNVEWLSNFNASNGDAIDKYLMLKYMFNTTYKKQGVTDLSRLTTDNVLLSLLDNDKILYTNRGFEGVGLDFIASPANETTHPLLSQARNYRVLQQGLANQKQSLLDLAKNLDDGSLTSARAQVNASQAQAMLDVVDEYIRLGAEFGVEEITNHMREVTKIYTENLSLQWLNQTPEQLVQTMVWYAPFTRAKAYDSFTKNYLETIIKNKELYEQQGILIDYFEDIDEYIFRLKKSHMPVVNKDTGKYYSNGIEIPKPTHFKEINNPVAKGSMDKLLIKAKEIINHLGNDNAFGTLGDTVTEVGLIKMFDGLPDVIKKEFDMFDFNDFSQYYFDEIKFNHMLIGDIGFRRQYANHLSTDIIKNYLHTTEYVLEVGKTHTLYTEYMTNAMMSLKNTSLGSLPDEELYRFFKNSDTYSLGILVKDDTYKSGYKLEQVVVNKLEDITTAKNLNAVAFPNQTFSKAFQVINSSKGKLSNPTMSFLNKLMFSYKAGYMMSAGTVMRNTIDSFIRTMASNDSGLAETSSYFLKSIKMLQDYDSICDDIIMALDGLSQYKIDKYFNEVKNINMDKQLFQFVHDFIKDGPSAGEAEAWLKYVGRDDSIEGLNDMFNHVFKKVMKPNMRVEQTARFAQYLQLVERNSTLSEAMGIVAKTHFDYAIKTDKQKLIELVIPFYTYIQNSTNYWVSLLENKPWLFSVIRDVMTPIWNFDEYDAEELSWNKSLQYQITSGAIPLDNSGLTLKANPSFLDVFNLFGSPIDQITGKMSAPLQLLIKSGVVNMSGDDVGYLAKAMGEFRSKEETGQIFDEIMNLIPVAGVAYQRIQTAKRNYDRTDNPINLVLPTAFGATKQYPEQTKVLKAKKTYPKKFRPSNYIRSGNTNYSRYTMGMKKMYAKKTYVKNIYSKRRIHLKNYYPSNRINNDATVYQKLYTKQGRSRMLQRLYPNNPKHALKVIHSIFNQ